MSFERLDVQLEGTVLTGSLTTEPIKISKVEVEEFHSGFYDETEHPYDFKDISFD